MNAAKAEEEAGKWWALHFPDKGSTPSAERTVSYAEMLAELKWTGCTAATVARIGKGRHFRAALIMPGPDPRRFRPQRSHSSSLVSSGCTMVWLDIFRRRCKSLFELASW